MNFVLSIYYSVKIPALDNGDKHSIHTKGEFEDFGPIIAGSYKIIHLKDKTFYSFYLFC